MHRAWPTLQRLFGALAIGSLALAACAPAPAGAPAGAAQPAAATAPAATAPAANAPAVAASPAPAVSASLQVKVGSQGTVAERGIFIGLERGYFAEAGLDVDLIPVRADGIPLLVTGELDFANGGPEPSLFNAAQRGVGVKIVLYNIIIGEGDQSSAFVVRRDLLDSGQYSEPRDLRGRTVGTPPAAAPPQLFLRRLLAQGGLTLADVQNVPLPFTDLVPALANRGVDLAFLAEPFITVVERQGSGAARVSSGELYPGMVGNVLVIGPPFAERQPEAARRFVTATLRGVRDYYRAVQQDAGGRDEIVQILTKHTPMKDPSLYGRLLTSPVDPNSELSERPLIDLQDYYLETGALQQAIDVRQVVDRAYADYALQQLGRLP